MKRLCPLLACALVCFCQTARATVIAPYVWTGIGTNWRGQVTPDLSNGTAQLWFGDNVSQYILLPATVDISSVTLTDDNDIEFRSADSATTLTLRNGLTTDAGTSFARVIVGRQITLNLPTAQTLDVGNSGNLTLYGAVTGNAPVTFTGNSTYNNNPSLLLANLSGTASTYTGTLTLSSTGGTLPSLTLWNDDSLNAGASLVFTQGGRLSVHNTLNDLANAITLNTAGPGIFSVHPQDAALTLGGTLTLANHTTLQANATNAHYDYTRTNGVGNLSAPGPRNRNALILTGTLAETGGARALHVTGDGLVILNGTSAYTGGTNVGFLYGTTDGGDNKSTNAGGALVIGNINALPTGPIQSGYYDATRAAQQQEQNNNSGYVGAAASGLLAAQVDFHTFTTAINPNSTGAVGIDTLPGESVTPYAGDIDLTHFTTDTGTGIRLGTATEAILTGTITPQKNTYAFGNGGGTLTVRSSLTDNPQTEAMRNLNLFSSGGTPLGLRLQGSNSYSGGTFVGTGYLIFDGYDGLTNSIPYDGHLTAGGSAATIGASYIGITDNVASNTRNLLPGAMDATEFLWHFDHAATWGVIGFDSTNSSSPVTITDLDLSGFNNGVFVGTTSAATLRGTITPTDDANNANHATNPNAGNTLRVTAGVGGTLTVAARLADLGEGGSVPLHVVVGSPTSEILSNGTVVFDPRNSDYMPVANTYSGNTYVNNVGAVTLAAGSANAFGTGSIILQPHGGTVGLSTLTAGLTIPNDIVFAPADQNAGQRTATLAPTGDNDFTLAGSLSGPGNFQLATTASPPPRLTASTTPLHVTLAGDNSDFNGFFTLQNGTLILDHNHAAGHAQVEFVGGDGVLAVGPNAPAPTLYGLRGNSGTLLLPDAANLTINSDSEKFDHDFGGTITGYDGASTAASLTIAGTVAPDRSTRFVYLYGHNNYTGGTTITGQAALGLGASDSAGTGTITISATNGGLALNTGVTLTNPLVLNSGALAGLGNFAPTAINGDSSSGRHFTIGANQMLYPGIPGDDRTITGKLTLTGDVIFASGGTYQWTLQDPLRSDGYSTVFIDGNLDLTSLTATSFTFALNTIDAEGERGDATLSAGQAYSFTLLTTSGSITGFNAGNFLIDSAKFQSGLITNSEFGLALGADSKSIILTFTAVPEPSTYALLGLGLALVGFTCWRRRRT